MTLVFNIIILLLFVLGYYFICFGFLKLFGRKYNLKWKSLALILPLNLCFMGVIVLVEGDYNIDLYHSSIGFFYKGFITLFLWFIPHILSLIGLIGWGIKVLKE